LRILIKTIMIKYLYLMLIMFNNNLNQMQVWLVSWKVFVQKWNFHFMHPHAREQCTLLAQNH
jgi:hypothetical protein